MSILPAKAVLQEVAKKLARKTHAEVRFDDGSRAIYASDLSHYRQVPIGVVVPRTIEDIIATVSICRDYDLPILGRGAGTSLAGQTCNTAIVLDFSKYLHRLLELNPRRKYAWVEPGLINDHLRSAAERYALTFAPDPATHAYCTLGGMIGNNSCGAHSVMGGKTSENIEELDILTYDGLRLTVGATSEQELEQITRTGGRRGEIYRRLRNLRDTYSSEIRKRFPQIPRRVSGFNLDYLLPENGFQVARALVGTESTCVLVLKAKVQLMHSPQCRTILLIAYPDVFAAADMASRIREFDPIAIEGFERRVIDNERMKGKKQPGLNLYPEGGAWLLVEFGADSHKEALAKAKVAEAWIRANDRTHAGLRLLEKQEDQTAAMRVREGGLGASRVPGKQPDTYTGWEDAAVPPEKLGSYLRDFYKLLAKYNYFTVLYGHFGQGCIHARINFEMRTTAGVQQYRKFIIEASHLVVNYGGSLSGEHGDGQARGEMLPIMFGPSLVEAFREFKRIWDPAWKMNPGKVVNPYPIDTNLRTGPDYHPQQPLTIFQFPDDHGSIAAATERCFGVGKCRSLDGGTMCPSFQVTREEEHSTRGRARMLFEMLSGGALHDGWQDEHIHDALDLCLACKGCKQGCPASVDVATYKAEFLAHYYEGHARPAAAYSMARIDRWAALASRFPGLANLFTQTPALSAVAKKVAGVTQSRKMPAFPAQTFVSWVRKVEADRPRTESSRERVLLWPDTFNNHFFPHTAQAAYAVLEDAGYHVVVPKEHLCCGRPLYDFGLLDEAKSYLRRIMNVLAGEIAAGTAIVCLEPSCASVFRDELINLFPEDPAARRLSKQVILLGNFLKRSGYRPPELKGRAVIHGHCHHKSLFEIEPEVQLLARMGLETELLDSGCCGLAGSFGYESGHYDISMKIGERVLLPNVRAARNDTMIVSDGFSCRQQIMHGTRRHALHLAEVLQMALRAEGHAGGRYIESGRTQPNARYPLALAAALSAVVIAGGYAVSRDRRKARS